MPPSEGGQRAAEDDETERNPKLWNTYEKKGGGKDIILQNKIRK